MSAINQLSNSLPVHLSPESLLLTGAVSSQVCPIGLVHKRTSRKLTHLVKDRLSSVQNLRSSLIHGRGLLVPRCVASSDSSSSSPRTSNFSSVGNRKTSTQSAKKPLSAFTVGETYQGKVKGVVGFGCFVDIGCVEDVLIHVSDFAEAFVPKHSDLVAVGDEVTMRLTHLEANRSKGSFKNLMGFEEKVNVASKNVEARENQEVKYDITDSYEGVVERVTMSGAVVKFDDDKATGFLPVEELPEAKEKEKDELYAPDLLQANEKITVRVKEVQGRGRMVLTTKTVEEIDQMQEMSEQLIISDFEGENYGILKLAFEKAGIVRSMFESSTEEETEEAATNAAIEEEEIIAEPVVAEEEEDEEEITTDPIVTEEEEEEITAELVAAEEEEEEEVSAEPLFAEEEEEEEITVELAVAKEEKEEITAEPVVAEEEKEEITAEPVVAEEEKEEITAEPVVAKEEKEEITAEPVVAEEEKEEITAEPVVAEEEEEVVVIKEEENIEERVSAQREEKAEAIADEEFPAAEQLASNSSSSTSTVADTRESVKDKEDEEEEKAVASNATESPSSPSPKKSNSLVTAKMVKELRDITGAGMLDCKKALVESNGGIQAAMELLKKKGIATASKRADRIASEGLIANYVHHDKKLGILLEVNSETDFVARNDQFKIFVDDVAMTIASNSDVLCVAPEDYPAEVLEKEKQVEMTKEDLLSKPENIREQIVMGRLEKLKKTGSVLGQAFIRDPKITVEEALNNIITSLGEKLSIRRFERFVLGEGLEKKSTDFASEVTDQIEAKKAAAATAAASTEEEEKAAAPVEEKPVTETKAELKIAATQVKELRELTGGGILNCKKALVECHGDIDAAVEFLRKKGLAGAAKKADRLAAEGIISSYIHTGSKLGVMVEINCETDFVARGEVFKTLVDDITLMIAACPEVEYVDASEVPLAVKEKELELEMQKEDLLQKPEGIRQKIAEGRLQKNLKTLCLFDQPTLKDADKTVETTVQEVIAALGENIRIRRFVRFNLGEGMEKKESNFAEEVAQQTSKS